MVYMDPGELGWRPCVKSWMQREAVKLKDETKVNKRCVTSGYERLTSGIESWTSGREILTSGYERLTRGHERLTSGPFFLFNNLKTRPIVFRVNLT